MKRYLIFLIILVVFNCQAQGNYQHKENIDGVYSRLSLTNIRTGQSPEALDRQGLLIMKEGHYAMMTQNADRHLLVTIDSLSSIEEKNDYLDLWLAINAHSGRYKVEGDILIWYRDISENPKEIGTITKLQFTQKDDQLILYFTLSNGDRYDWVWQKISSTVAIK
ncbi:MAG: hypothetical protein VYC67_05125 [Pseudomonadota bacterium]|nr:hypothetical protein [Pseudomonadota bacterium]